MFKKFIEKWLVILKAEFSVSYNEECVRSLMVRERLSFMKAVQILWDKKKISKRYLKNLSLFELDLLRRGASGEVLDIALQQIKEKGTIEYHSGIIESCFNNDIVFFKSSCSQFKECKISQKKPYPKYNVYYFEFVETYLNKFLTYDLQMQEEWEDIIEFCLEDLIFEVERQDEWIVFHYYASSTLSRFMEAHYPEETREKAKELKEKFREMEKIINFPVRESVDSRFDEALNITRVE